MRETKRWGFAGLAVVALCACTQGAGSGAGRALDGGNGSGDMGGSPDDRDAAAPDPDDGIPPPDPDAGVPDPDGGGLDPDDGPGPADAGSSEPDVAIGPVGDCAEITADACFANLDCPDDRRCANVGTELDPVACCIPGERGDRGAGEPCGADGEANCESAVCIDEGDVARCSGTCDDAADCPAGLRLCAPIAFSGSEASWCLPDGSGDCRAPQPGDVLVDEILVDAFAPERENEFVELVSTAAQPIALAGLVLRSNRGDSLGQRVRFDSGCLAPGGRVAIYESVDAWIWNPAPVGVEQASTNAFGFANGNDFTFVLETADGAEIDRAQGPAALIEEGVSVNRDPTATRGAPFARHDAVGAGDTSPGRAP